MRRSLSIIIVTVPRWCKGDETLLRVMALCGLCALFAAAAGAQAVADGVIHGTVRDPMQTVVADAGGTIMGSSTTVKTDAAGQFSIALASGTYAVTVVAPGFAPATTSVIVRGGQTTAPRITLVLAGLREDVTVTASAGVTSSTRTATPLRDVPQSVTVISEALIKDQLMTSVADTMRYVPGVTMHQGENNRDQVIIRGNSSSADFFVNGVRDDVQYYRDLYNLDRVEALKGPNALIFGRGGAGGVINRVTKEAGFTALREFTLEGGSFGTKRFSTDLDQPVTD